MESVAVELAGFHPDDGLFAVAHLVAHVDEVRRHVGGDRVPIARLQPIPHGFLLLGNRSHAGDGSGRLRKGSAGGKVQREQRGEGGKRDAAGKSVHGDLRKGSWEVNNTLRLRRGEGSDM